MTTQSNYIKQVQSLNVAKRGDRRAPHKPLLLLLAIARTLDGYEKLTFEQVETTLTPLLDAYAPAVQSRHQPELPYWHLMNDGLWNLDTTDDIPRQSGGFPQMAALRASSGRLEPNFAEALKADFVFTEDIVSAILYQYFPESLHNDILQSVGLIIPKRLEVAEEQPVYTVKRPRDPKFSSSVLRAYEHRCAVTGFRAALGGRYFGCEAAHVQWHAYEGPDEVSNGIALEPTIHKLFDAGAWTLSDDLEILVSAELTGSDETINRIRSYHGKSLRSPLPGNPTVQKEFIQWHREPDLGAVFRQPWIGQ